MSRNVIALITATLLPRPDMTHVAIADQAIRIAEYCECLRHITKEKSFDSIYFLENSCSSTSNEIGKIIDEFRGMVEVLSIDVSDVPGTNGKGNMELITILRAIDLIKPEKDTLIVKISGRYMFMNHQEYVRFCRSTSAVVLCFMQKNLNFSDTKVFAATPEFIKIYLGRFAGIIDDSAGFFIEHALSRAVHAMLTEAYGEWRLPKVKPMLLGVSGSTGGNLKGGSVKFAFDAIVHRVRRAIIER